FEYERSDDSTATPVCDIATVTVAVAAPLLASTGAGSAAAACIGTALACLLLLNGCSSAPAPAERVTGGAPRSSPSTLPLEGSTVPPFRGVQGEIPALSEIYNDPELRDHVALRTCSAMRDG